MGTTLAVAAAAVLVVGFLVTQGLNRAVPQFASLARHPDRSLRGAVAYYADQSRCVKVVAAAGQPTKTVFCVPKMDVATAVKKGKEIGPQLVWLPGGRLEVTMFRMMPPAKPGAVPAWRRGWQKIIDVRTGDIEDVPAAKVPAQPNRATHPMVSPTGQRISWTSDNGLVTVRLTSHGRSRTLLSVRGPGEYTYRLGAAFWAPNWQWIAADDGRILIITTGRHPATRVLTSESSQGAFSAGLARFAVTGASLLSTASVRTRALGGPGQVAHRHGLILCMQHRERPANVCKHVLQPPNINPRMQSLLDSPGRLARAYG